MEVLKIFCFVNIFMRSNWKFLILRPDNFGKFNSYIWTALLKISKIITQLIFYTKIIYNIDETDDFLQVTS